MDRTPTEVQARMIHDVVFLAAMKSGSKTEGQQELLKLVNEGASKVKIWQEKSPSGAFGDIYVDIHVPNAQASSLNKLVERMQGDLSTTLGTKLIKYSEVEVEGEWVRTVAPSLEGSKSITLSFDPSKLTPLMQETAKVRRSQNTSIAFDAATGSGNACTVINKHETPVLPSVRKDCPIR